ncbi:MAG: Xaa-Pro peptidase family protein [Caldimicrobium sp.]|nr:Xaa-Pro peptidase family protein [Caldimicrobium sp.]MCX7873151.1 Xaa-Pro peptidase family protein [Caldimicrobium sp.]MDW8094271.1 Xaa-Pro peptidase family protein [Caldimicrobium sp.]
MNFYGNRLKGARELLSRWSLEAFLFNSYPNVFYLTGLKASLAFLIITEQEAYLLTDARYIERARKLAQAELKVELIEGDTLRFLKKFLKDLRVRRIGFESDRVSCDFRRALRSREYSLFGITHPLKEQRLKKDIEEQKAMKGAIEITDKIYFELLNYITSELTELELRGRIVELAFKFLAEGEAFPSIVAVGEHSAIPHWESSRAPLRANKPLLLDFGVIFNGYCSDFTRTIYWGNPDEEFKRYYEMVKSAWFKAFERVKVGVPVFEVDKVVRSYFQEKGVISHFTHSTGHGIGIEVHEYPRIFWRREASYLKKQPLIEEGMVFTIEPGLYFEGKYGIRLENVVFVEGGEGKIHSQVPLELISL